MAAPQRRRIERLFLSAHIAHKAERDRILICACDILYKIGVGDGDAVERAIDLLSLHVLKRSGRGDVPFPRRW